MKKLKKGCFCLLLLICGIPCLSRALIIQPVDLLDKIIQAHEDIRQFSLTLKINVYDPEQIAPINELLKEKYRPKKKRRQSFQQTIIWIRDEFLSIETYNWKHKLVNIYLAMEGQEFFHNLSPIFYVTKEDLLSFVTSFYTVHPAIIKSYLHESGISFAQVTYQQKKNGVYFKLGDENGFLLIDPELYRVEEINRTIQIYGMDYSLRTVMTSWHHATHKWNGYLKYIPKTMHVYLNGRLMKKIQVLHLNLNGLWPKKKKVLQKYKHYFSSMNRFNPMLNYAQ